MSFISTKKIFTFLAALFLAGVIAFYALGPAVLERVIVSQMRAAGLVEPDVRVDAITHKGVYLSRLSAQQPRMNIDSGAILFSIDGLLQGRVDEIILSGLKFFAAIKDNELDLGLPASDNDAETSPPVLPFKTIKLNSSSLVLNFQGKDFLIPFSSRIEHIDEYTLSFAAWPIFLGLPLSVTGQSNVATLETSIHAQALWSEFLGPGSKSQVREEAFAGNSGSFDAWLSLHWLVDSEGKARGAVNLEALADDVYLDGPGFELGLEKGTLSLTAMFDDNLFFDRFDTDLILAGLSFNENFLEGINLSLREHGSSVKFSSTITRPVAASLELSGKQTSINDLLGDAMDYGADLEWKAKCELDFNRYELFSPEELEFDRPIRAFGHGNLNTGFSSDPDKGENSWYLQVVGKKTEISPVSVHLHEHELRISDLSFKGPFSIETDPVRFKMELPGNSRLSIKEVSLEQDSERYLVKGLNFKNQPGSPFVVFEAREEGFRSLFWSVEQDGGFETDLTGATILGRELRTEGYLLSDSEGVQLTDIRISSEISRVHLEDLGVVINDIYFDFPFILGDADSQPGSFSTGSVVYSGLNLPGMTGRIIVDNYRVDSRGEWSFLPGAMLEFSTDVVIDPDKGMAGKIHARTNWFDFPDKETLDRLMPGLEEMTITGSARAELDLELRGPLLLPLLQIDFSEGRVVDPDMELEASGISGTLVIDDFFPLTTPGNQSIDISRFKIGRLELVDGFLTLRVESPKSVFLEKTRWNLPEGGFIAAHASRFNLEDLSADFEIFFEDIDLLKLVSRLSEEKIVGSGLVYGRIPLLYEHDRVMIGDGYLYSVPGVGRLGIRDEEWLETLLLYVRDAMSGHPYLSLVSERLEQALRDFEYDFLAVNLKPGPEDTAARIELRGRGVEGDPPQEVGSLVINVNDLGEIVNRVLRFQLTRDESIERALEDLLGF